MQILWSLDAMAGESTDLSQLPANQGHQYFLGPRYAQDGTPEPPCLPGFRLGSQSPEQDSTQ